MSKQAEKQNKRCGVLICGAYGMSNAGDEAILEAVVGEMRSIDPELPITVLSRTPQDTAEKFNVKSLHMFNVPGFLREMRRCSLYINGGGSLIQDVTSSRSLWYYLYTISAARRRGCKVLMYGCGIGPVSRRFNRKLTGRILSRCVDAITLREENSLAELNSFGVEGPEVVVASDPALTLGPADEELVDGKMRMFGLDPAGSYICFCLRRWNGFEDKAEAFAHAADRAYGKYGLTPVFLAVNTKGDGTAAQAAAEYMTAPHVIISEPLSTPMTIGLIARMQAVVSIRLHGLIFAASQAVPIAGVVYDPKVSSFLDSIGQNNYIRLEDVTEERLYGLIDRALSADAQQLKAETERLRRQESENVLMAKRLLNMK